MKKNIGLTSLLFTFANFLNGQSIPIPLALDNWVTGKTEANVEKFMGKESISVKAGLIYTKSIEMLDGTFEVDINFPQQRSFPGFALRVIDQYNFECFYLRPHQSGNPDATQYTPVFNDQAGWQLYHGDGFSAATDLKPGVWHHIKIELHGLQAEFYVDTMEKPMMKVVELKREWEAGKIALIGGGANVHFANPTYTPKQGNGSAPKRIPVPTTGEGGLITQWQVSNIVDKRLFIKKNMLTPDITDKLKWTSLSTEPSGTINFAKVGALSDSLNTILAKVEIESTEDQVKEVTFGFSDYVLVFLNGKALYYGNDRFLSRDYRYLGTIGFFDKLFLPLRKGRNELCFAIAEDFGGWALKAKLESMENITLR